MLKTLTVSILLIGSVFATVAAHASSDRPDHFKGKAVETVAQAQANIAEYNRQMAEILAGDSISAKNMAQIHMITYTLENALQHIEQQLDKLQKELEEIHLASERNDSNTIRQVAPGYLSGSSELFD